MENLPSNELPDKSPEKIIDEYSEKRLKLWEKLVKRISKNEELKRALSAAVNATVGSYVKLSAEAIRGKTIEGQELTPAGRLMDALIVGTGLGGYVLGATGSIPEGAVSYGLSWAGWGLMYGPDILTPIIDRTCKALEKNPNQNQLALNMFNEARNGINNLKNVWFRQTEK